MKSDHVFEPIDLLVAFDSLDAAWRLAFGKSNRLVGPGSLEPVAQVTQPVSNRDEFLARLVDLASVFDRLQVPDSLKPPGAPTVQWVQLRSLGKIEAINEANGDEAGVSAARQLRKISNLNNALKHNAQHAAKACSTMGISYPITDWSLAWRTVGSSALLAVRGLSAASVRFANDS